MKFQQDFDVVLYTPVQQHFIDDLRVVWILQLHKPFYVFNWDFIASVGMLGLQASIYIMQNQQTSDI